MIVIKTIIGECNGITQPVRYTNNTGAFVFILHPDINVFYCDDVLIQIVVVFTRCTVGMISPLSCATMPQSVSKPSKNTIPISIIGIFSLFSNSHSVY